MASITIKSYNNNSSLFLLYTITQSSSFLTGGRVFYGIKVTLFDSNGAACDCCAVDMISSDRNSVSLLTHSLCRSAVLPCTFRALFADQSQNISIHTLLYCIC